MIYLDYGATSFHKPPAVYRAVEQAMRRCANPGRGGYPAANAAAETVYTCRETAAELFDCRPEQVVLTSNCTHGLNIAIRSLIKPGGRVVVSGFEHNAVMRPLYALEAEIRVAGRRLFDWENTLEEFDKALRAGADGAVFTHVSNVFGYVLPVRELAKMCQSYSVPFILDAAQSAGSLPVKLRELGAQFIAMPGHKGLLGPQGTGLLLCAGETAPLLFGGTGSESIRHDMPDLLPERLEAGTMNVPGAAGLTAGMRHVKRFGDSIRAAEHRQAQRCAQGLQRLGFRVFTGPNQAATVSFLPETDCQQAADRLAKLGIAVRAGLHCAPLAHESAGTLDTGTVRVSFGPDASDAQTTAFLNAAARLWPGKR
ncbi:MAG: aminotransferase class V-fold PLP-dependent enzyme [Faecousia sp.]